MKKEKSMIGILAQRSFRTNRSRNLVALLAIVLTTMMFAALFTLTQSMGQNMTEMYLRQSGTQAHTTTKSITKEEAEKIAAHPDVKAAGNSIVLGLAENARLAGQQVEIRYADAQYAKDDFALPTTGRLPEKKDEIALDTLVLDRLGVSHELGSEVTLEWRKDLQSDEITFSTLRLCGTWEGNQSVYASMAWVSEEFALEACGGDKGPEEGQILGARMMGVTFDSSRNIEEKIQGVLEDTGLTHLEFNTVMAYGAQMQQSIFMENIPMYVGMLLVFVAGYLVIFNVFQISVASDIQFYGKLKTLGTGTRQIRRIILGQGNRLSLWGIPVGLVLGYLLGMVLVPVLISGIGTEPKTSASPVIFVGSALLSYGTVVISCLLPARRAARVSPVEALRYTDADSGIRRKTKKSTNGTSLYAMAWSNLWRNKKRTVMVLCSLTLGLVLMSFFYAKNASMDMEKYVMDLTVADYQVDDATNMRTEGYDPLSDTISEELLSRVEALSGLEETGRLFYRETEGMPDAQARENITSFYNENRLAEYESYDPNFPMWKEEFDRMAAGESVPYVVYGMDGLILDAAVDERYQIEGDFDRDAFLTGDYIVAIGPDASREPGENLPTWSVGSKVEIQGREFTVMAVVKGILPAVEGTTPVFGDFAAILPADTFLELWPDSHLRKFYFNVGDGQMEEAGEMLEEYQQEAATAMNITSRKTIVEQYEEQTRSASVMGYAVSAVVALVGVINFVNSMVTAIISRRREFAMIQSIGMTKRQLRCMLVFEGLGYAGLTLIASYIIGAVTVGVVVKNMVEGGFATFHFTLLPLVICTPLLLIFAVLIPYVCFRNLEKQSIVERLRAVD